MSTFDDYIPGRFEQSLAAARGEHARGRRVIGYLGDDVPVELILAANALPVRLDFALAPVTPGADRFLESSFGPLHRAHLEQWLRGNFDFMNAVVFPRSDDAAQRLYYYVCELQRRSLCKGPTPLIYDLARIDRATSRQHTIAATRTLARALGASLDKLEVVSQRMSHRLAFARRLTMLRTQEQAIAGSDVWQAWRALQLDWTDAFEARAREWSTLAQRRSCVKRFVIAGSMPPDDRLHRAIEAGGGNVVDEWFDGSLAQCVSRWGHAGTQLDSIADAYRAACSTAVSFMRSPSALLERSRALGAHGVVLWLAEEDEGIVWEYPQQLAQLRDAGMPTLALARQARDADAAVLARITQFAREGSA